MCQLEEVNLIAEKNSRLEGGLSLARRIPRFLRNRFRLVRYRISGKGKKFRSGPTAESLVFKPGDRVRIRSREEIKKTLDGWQRHRGCRFMDEMWQYCGGVYRIQKKVERMLDERQMQMKKTRDTYILEGLICTGSWPFKDCDRSCFYFWKSSWLEKAS